MAAIKLGPVKLGAQKPTVNTSDVTEDSFDGEQLHQELLDGTQGVDDLHRKQLIAVAHFLGAGEEDTRGRPVKVMRELVTTLMATVQSEPAEALKPAKLAATKKLGTPKLAGPAKLARRL